MTDKQKNKTFSRQQELMHGFGFNSATLEANRRGEITPEQQVWILKREGFRWKIGFLLGFLALTVLFFLLPIWSANQASNYTQNDYNSDIIILLFCRIPFLILTVSFLLWALRNQYRLRAELKRGELAVMQGLAIVDPGNDNKCISLSINNIKFKAPRKAVLRVKHLEPHIVYYLPRSKVILSVEVVEND